MGDSVIVEASPNLLNSYTLRGSRHLEMYSTPFCEVSYIRILVNPPPRDNQVDSMNFAFPDLPIFQPTPTLESGSATAAQSRPVPGGRHLCSLPTSWVCIEATGKSPGQNCCIMNIFFVAQTLALDFVKKAR